MLPVGVHAAAVGVALLGCVAVPRGDRGPQAAVLLEGEHLGAVLPRDLRRSISRAVVDHEDVCGGISPSSSLSTAGRFSASFQAGMKTSVSLAGATR